MWCCVDLMRTDVSEECVASIFSEIIYKRGNALAVGEHVSSLSNFSTVTMEATRSSETLVLTRPTQLLIPEDEILQCLEFSNIFVGKRSSSIPQHKIGILKIKRTMEQHVNVLMILKKLRY
jgi:hypothetical protein